MSPSLPGDLVMIDRGGLEGLVLIADLSSVYAVQFQENGQVSDLGATDVGEGIPAMVGAIGVQP